MPPDVEHRIALPPQDAVVEEDERDREAAHGESAREGQPDQARAGDQHVMIDDRGGHGSGLSVSITWF